MAVTAGESSPGPGVPPGTGRRDTAPSAAVADWRALGAAAHIVQFYEDDAPLLDAVAAFIGAALGAGEAGIVIVTPAHRAGIEARLRAAGLDLEAARGGGRYIALDAAATLDTFMVAGAPDSARFAAVIGGLIARAGAGGRGVRAFGEMVALLAGVGDHAAALLLERLWHDLQQAHSFALFCAYPLGHFAGEGHEALHDLVCAAHSHVIPAESYAALSTPDARLREIAALQRKARQLEAEVAARRRAEEELRAALRARDEFLTVAAHELKTPLTSLLGYAQLLQRQLARGTADPGRVARAVRTIGGQAERLTALMTQLLDISRLEAGNLALAARPTDLAALVARIVADLDAGEGQHTITVTAPASLMAVVDPLRLEQVIINLLDNARKYSPDGGPVVVTLDRAADDVVEVAVTDRGLGIPPERRARLFERFYRAHSERHTSGWGLGLHISRQIVELHGGTIHAEFPPDGGTRFVVRLPVAACSSVVIVADA